MRYRIRSCGGELLLNAALLFAVIAAGVALRSGEASGLRVADFSVAQRPAVDFSIASRRWRSGRAAGWSVCWTETGVRQAQTQMNCFRAEVWWTGLRGNKPQ